MSIGMVAQACYLNTPEVEARGQQIGGQPGESITAAVDGPQYQGARLACLRPWVQYLALRGKSLSDP